MIELEANISLKMEIAIGEVGLNEIVYKIKEIRNEACLELLKNILMKYDDIICERLSETKIYPKKAIKGLGRHKRKGDPEGRYCRGRKLLKRGYRSNDRNISTCFGKLILPLRVAECCTCHSKYSPLLNALGIGAYSRKEDNFENEVIEAVIDTNYRRLIEGRSIDISLGGIHNIVVGSKMEEVYNEPVSVENLSGIMADGTGVKQAKGKKGELRAVIGIDKKGRVKPLGCFTNTKWAEIEGIVRDRLKTEGRQKIPFVFDSEPGLDTFLSDIAESQRCTWHAPRGLYHALWEDGLKKKESRPQTNKVKKLIGIELSGDDFELISDNDIEKVRTEYETSRTSIEGLITIFREKGYEHGASYLESLSGKLFKHIELWLETGVIAPKTTSLLERVFREIGRRLKRIAWGWSDKAVTNLSKMIMIKQYSKEQWEAYWKEKLGIKGFFNIRISSVLVT